MHLLDDNLLIGFVLYANWTKQLITVLLCVFRLSHPHSLRSLLFVIRNVDDQADIWIRGFRRGRHFFGLLTPLFGGFLLRFLSSLFAKHAAKLLKGANGTMVLCILGFRRME